MTIRKLEHIEALMERYCRCTHRRSSMAAARGRLIVKTGFALLLALTVTRRDVGDRWHALPLHHDGQHDLDDVGGSAREGRVPRVPVGQETYTTCDT